MVEEGGMSPNDAASSPSLTKNSCWKKSCDESQSFWGNLKNQFHLFTQTPIADHKNCFKLTLLTMKDNLSSSVKSIVEAQGPIPSDDSTELPW